MESIADLSQKRAQAYDVADTPENRAKIQDVLFHFQENVPKNETVQHRLQMHADSGRIQVALINFSTGEVIEEIPSSKLLDFRHELEKNESLLLEEKAWVVKKSWLPKGLFKYDSLIIQEESVANLKASIKDIRKTIKRQALNNY